MTSNFYALIYMMNPSSYINKQSAIDLWLKKMKSLNLFKLDWQLSIKACFISHLTSESSCC